MLNVEWSRVAQIPDPTPVWTCLRHVDFAIVGQVRHVGPVGDVAVGSVHVPEARPYRSGVG